MRTCRRTSSNADACCLSAFFAMAGTVNVEAAELCHCPTCSRRLSTCLHLAQPPPKTQTAPSLPNAMGSALPPPHKRPATALTISLVFGVQLNLSIASATNETRAFPRVGRERRIQARELGGFSDAYWSE